MGVNLFPLGVGKEGLLRGNWKNEAKGRGFGERKK